MFHMSSFNRSPARRAGLLMPSRKAVGLNLVAAGLLTAGNFAHGGIITGGSFPSQGSFQSFVRGPNTATFTWNTEPKVTIPDTTENAKSLDYAVQLVHSNLSLQAGQVYTACFTASARGERPLKMNIEGDDDSAWAERMNTGAKLT